MCVGYAYVGCVCARAHVRVHVHAQVNGTQAWYCSRLVLASARLDVIRRELDLTALDRGCNLFLLSCGCDSGGSSLGQQRNLSCSGVTGTDLPLASARSHVIGWSWVLLRPTQGRSWFLLSPGATGADFTEWQMGQRWFPTKPSSPAGH